MTLAEIVQWTDEAGRYTDGPGYSPVTEKQRQRLAQLSRKAKARRARTAWIRKFTQPVVQLAACIVAIFIRSHN